MEMETYAFDGDNAEVRTALASAGAEHALDTVVHAATPTQRAKLQGKPPSKSKTDISVVAVYFDRTITDAAKILGICPTVLKKICRKHGLKRWPNRRVRSIDKQLSVLRAAVEDGSVEDDRLTTAINEQIELLQNERNKICFIE